MATKGDIESDLTLEVGGHAITPDKFLRSVRSFFAILDEVTREVGGKPSVVPVGCSSQAREQFNTGFPPARLRPFHH